MNRLLLSLNKVDTFLFVCLFKDIGNMLDFLFLKFRWIFLNLTELFHPNMTAVNYLGVGCQLTNAKHRPRRAIRPPVGMKGLYFFFLSFRKTEEKTKTKTKTKPLCIGLCCE